MSWLRYCLLASIVAVTVSSSSALTNADDDDEGEQEQRVSLKQLPDAVKATILMEILREVDALEIEEIEREIENGTIVYEAEVEFRNKEFELEISHEGKLLSKEVEIEDDDDDDD